MPASPPPGAPRPGRRGPRRDRCATSFGVPVRIGLPKSITMIRSARSITRPMSCSTITIGRPSSSRMSRMNRAMSSVSSRFIPATGSSSSNSFGSEASARPEFDPLLDAVRQQADREPPPLGELEEVDDLLDGPAVGPFVAPGLADPREGCEHAVRVMVVPAEHQVVEHGQVGEQLDVLEGAGDAERARSRAAGGRSGPRRRTGPCPAAAGRRPESTLKIEVLPAPFGPITANSSPGFTVKLTPLRAVTPSNPRTTSRT